MMYGVMFVQSIWKSVVQHQSLEIAKAICNQTNELHLVGCDKYLVINREDLYNIRRDN